MNNFKVKGNKILCVWLVCLAIVFFAWGCTTSTETKDNEDQRSEVLGNGGRGSESSGNEGLGNESTGASKDQQDSAASGETFYKLRVQDAELDENSILSAWIPSFDTSKVSTASNAEGITKQITVEGVTYSWTVDGNTLNGNCDKADSVAVDEETAKQIGTQFVETLGYQTAPVPSVSKDELGRITLEYTFQYEGVDILGNKILYIGLNDEEGTKGTYLSLTICDSGISSVCISNLIDITSSVTTYQNETDFVGGEQAVELTEAYYDKLFGESGAFAELMSRTEVSIIYMPYLENGKNMLIPVYEVTVLDTDGNSVFSAVLDAVTGYVYSAQ